MMPFESITAYYIKCDRCDEYDTDTLGNHELFTEKEKTEWFPQHHPWSMPGGQIICESCQEETP